LRVCSRRAAPAVTLALTAMLVGACGGGDDGPSEEDRVRETAQDFLDAIENGDGERVCELAGEDIQRGFRLVARMQGARFSGREGFGECPEAAEYVMARRELALPRGLEISNVAIHTDQATASLEGKGAQQGRLELDKIDSDWRVTKLP
jgi:hypothetical protein